MKTTQQIESEASQLAVLGRAFHAEQHGTLLPATSRPLMVFPASSDPSGPQRTVEATVLGGALVFRLMERDDSAAEATLLASSPSAFEIVSAGYEIAEEERLAAALERYAERSEERADPANAETVAEVETILENKHLPAADRLRTRAEVVEFLEGRLEPNILITRAIERQCSRESHCEHRVERHELKLTIGEP